MLRPIWCDTCWRIVFSTFRDALDAQHIAPALDKRRGVVQVGNLRSCALAGRTRSTSAPAKADLPVESCHPCPKPLQNDQHHQRTSLQLLMTETGRCLSLASKARTKRSSNSGTSRSIAATETAWRSL